MLFRQSTSFQAKVLRQFWQNLANLGQLKCDPNVKHLFLWLLIVLQHKPHKRYFDIGNKILKVYNR